MLNFVVNEKRCTHCGNCALDCPSQIIDQKGKALPHIVPEKEAGCIQCQHCLAVCPTAAISIFGRDPDRSLPLSSELLPSLDQMTHLIRGRRSVRQYKDENVAPELIRQLLGTLANVPTGVNRRELTFTVIADKALMSRLRDKVLTALDEAGKAGRLPQHFSYLLEASKAFREQGRDILFRKAPHALIVSAPKDAPCPNEDVALALAYFDTLAQSAGLGTVWWGMFKMVMETIPTLKSLVGLPPKHAYYAMLFGIPAVHYRRTVQRDDGAVVRMVKEL